MRWALLACLMAAAGAGCLGGACSSEYVGATWHDPLLFGAMEREARMAEAGLPIRGGAVVTLLHDGEVRDGGGFRIGPAGLDLQARGVSEADVEQGLRAFLDRATGQVDDAYVEAFIESGDESDGVATYAHFLPDGLDLQALYDASVGGQEPARTMQGGGWTWTMAYPAKSIVVGPADLSVDAVGATTVAHAWPRGTSQADAERDVRGWLADAGLPAPAAMRIEGTDC